MNTIKILLIITLLSTFISCKSTKMTKHLTSKVEKSFFDNHFTGILVVDANSKDTVVSYNANKYFTPASNTKIITLYAALQLLSEKIPALKYSIKKDTITILGTGNPTFLHPFFKDSTTLKFIKKYKNVKIVQSNLKDNHFAAGWAWEDYDTYFSPEKTSFPLYGNVLEVTNTNGLQCIPSILKDNLSYSTTEKFRRKLTANTFFYNPKSTKIREVPMLMNTSLLKKLWNALLPNRVTFTSNIPDNMEVLYSETPSDSLYKRMMYKSDNFLAEHMLLIASSTMSDTLNSNDVRKYILKNQLIDLKQQPRWVDGSGLSRYNLFTPTIFVEVLSELHNDISQKRLFDFFPIGREDISTWYLGKPKQYMFAKSGYLSNNYNLSGYLITNSGKTLIFSFMNNHYKKPTSELKKQMQTFFEYLRDNY